MKRLASLFIMTLVCLTTMAQGYVPTKENLAARKQFQDNKFGIFIHWGVYSMLGQGEWIQYYRKINVDEYAKLPRSFCPSRFNAEEWVKAIKASGAKYITITSRHHDGFSMFKTATSDYNIVDGTPFKRDVLKELAEACKKHGITLNFYYSHLDWHRPDYPVASEKDLMGRDPKKADYASYLSFMKTQLTELLTNYGKIGAIWFDGVWNHDPRKFDWHLREQYDLIHRLQPACLVINNHHLKPFDGEDAQTFEQDLPGQNTAGLSPETEIGQLPLETCLTMNDTWGYNITDTKYKSTETLLHYLIRAAGMNGNLLLNIGPRPDGTIPDMALERMKEMGQWLARYGETIYGTRGGLIAPQSWGVTTQKGNTLYIHLLKHDSQTLQLPAMGRKVKSAQTFGGAKKVKVKQSKKGVTLTLPEVPTGIDYIVKVELK